MLLFASALAPEHAHHVTDGHEHPLLHSHFEPHRLAIHDHDATEVAQDSDEDVLWIGNVALDRAPYHLSAPIAVLEDVSPVITLPQSWCPIARDEGASAHGPPRHPARYRGPPRISA